MTVTKEIADANPNNYAIVLTAANYVAVRLREIPPMGSLADAGKVRSPAAVRFMASAAKLYMTGCTERALKPLSVLTRE